MTPPVPVDLPSRLLNVARQDVDFQVDRCPASSAPQVVRSAVWGMMLTPNRSVGLVLDLVDGQRDAVQRQRALGRDIAAIEVGRRLEARRSLVALGPARRTSATPSTWPETIWPPSSSPSLERPFEVDRRPAPVAQRGRARVSAETSTANQSSPLSTTVRQTPEQAIEAPRLDALRVVGGLDHEAGVAWAGADPARGR